MRKPEFKLLLNENATYGFYRNLYGMTHIAVMLSALTIVAGAAFAGWHLWRDATFDLTSAFVVIATTAIHASYFLFVITKDTVNRAATTYANELYGAAQQLMSQALPAAAE
jgi:hypothetical protein